MPPELFEILKSGGPAAIFAFLWWIERVERKELSDKLNEMGRDVIAAMGETKAALNALGSIFNGNTSGR